MFLPPVHLWTANQTKEPPMSFWNWIKSVFAPYRPLPAELPSNVVHEAVRAPEPAHLSDSALDNRRKGTLDWYEAAWDLCKFDPGCAQNIARAAERCRASRSRYEKVSAKTGVPWYMIAGIHSMESSNDFRGILHNGEHIIGTGRKTKLVPRGRGPFASWEEAAIDALRIEGLTAISKWPIELILKQCEAYNGLGYLKYHPLENSPYLWAQTSVNDGRGKYTGDGRWDPNANANAQVGLAAILKQLELWGEIKVTRMNS